MWVVWFFLRLLSLASDLIPLLCPHTVGVFSSCSGQRLLSSCDAWTSHCGGFSHCRAQALWCVGLVVAVTGPQSTGSVVVVHGLRCFAHVGASWTREGSRVSCTGRWILCHLASREAPICIFLLICLLP